MSVNPFAGRGPTKTEERRRIKAFLARQDRAGLRRALWFCRRQDARPHEINCAAAQYDGLATSGTVRAEYRRRGWEIPKPTPMERPER